MNPESMKKITIVDYGLGNIRAFANVYRRLNMPYAIATKSEELQGAERLILPGVGAFDAAMDLLQKSGMRDLLDELVIQKKVPVLGICVGMQMLAHSSEEGSRKGLAWIDGEVKKFDVAGLKHKTQLPHMGWNTALPKGAGGLFSGMDSTSEGGRFYFLHSYYFHCQADSDVLAVTDYGGKFCSAVGSGHIYGVQFHPEKSHRHGVQLLKNFGEMA